MFHNANAEKVKQAKPKTKTVMFTIFWFVLVAAVLLVIAFAGHI